MTTDINQRVLAAFQSEHKEQLESIRALILDVEREEAAVSQSRLDEAFRQAHSLKGAARVCDLRPIETLGHRLETLFSRVRQGNLWLDREVVKVVNLVLDSIEDWMASFANNQTPSEPTGAIEAIEQLLGRPKSESKQSEKAEVPEITRRLREAFQSEYPLYVAGIREFLASVQQGVVDVDHLEEAFRMAHSLKGAARVAEVAGVEKLGQRLETMFSRVREKTLDIDHEVARTMRSVLDAVEEEMDGLAERGVSDGESQTLQAIDQFLGKQSREAPSDDEQPPAETAVASQPGTSFAQVETVRVTTESLDRLLRSAGQLHIESLRQDQVARELHDLSRQIDEMERQREALRKAAAASLHRLGDIPQFSRIARYLDAVDVYVRSLSRSARRVRLLQQRSSWLLGALGEEVQHDVRRARMAPAESVFQGFRKMVRDMARDEGKEVELAVSGFDVQADRMVLQSLKDPLMHALRNAVIHGIESPAERTGQGKDETGRVTLRIEAVGSRLQVTVDDDGRGINVQRVTETALRRGLISQSEADERSPAELARLIFQPGFTTSKVVNELAGRGMGLSVLYEAVARLQGEVQIQPKDTPGSCFVLTVPLSISTHRMLLVACGGQTFSIPLHGIQRLLRINVAEVETVEGKPIVNFQGELVPLVGLAHLLGISESEFNVEGGVLQVVVLQSATRRVALAVDAFLAERDSLIQELDGPAAALHQFAGGILLEDGSVALVLNPAKLIEKMKTLHRPLAIKTVAAREEEKPPTVLVVDDSFTTRTLEKSILEAHGYRVRIAVDGIEALSQLRAEDIDLVIADIQMPRLDGFGLLEEIKKDKRLSALPVILVTSMDRGEDQQRGLALGADAYIVKRKFDHQDLLDTIRQVI